MLEFVHLSGPAAGKDEQTRRKVRSQAMRDYRRRQRAENDRRRNTSPQPISDRPTESSSSNGRNHAGRARAQDELKHALTASTRSSKMTDSTTNTSISFMDWNEEVTQYGDVLSTACPASVSAQREQTWSTLSDSFDSHEHVNEMFQYCKSYLEWLCPEINSTTAATVLTSRQGLECSPTSLAALCLASVGHLDAVRGDQSSLDYALYKAKVFQNINERMTLSNGVVSNETVAYLACLLSYEMSKCSPEAILHLQGLQSIIRLRGGMTTLSEPLCMMLECLDLCHSIIFEEKPILALMDNPRTWTTNVEQHLDNCNALHRLLRQEAENFYHETPVTNAYKQRLLYTPQLIQDIIDVMQFLGPISDFWRNVDIPEDVIEPYRQRLQAARSLTLEPDNTCPDAHYLARIVYLRVLLTYKLDVLRVHPDLSEIQEIIDGLWITMQKISEPAWQSWPYMRLWIVLATIHLARRPHIKSYFEAQLVRSVYRMGLDEWPRSKTFIVRFLSARSMFMTFLLEPQTTSGTHEASQVREAMPDTPLPWEIGGSELDSYIDPVQQYDHSSSILSSTSTAMHQLDALSMEPSTLALDSMYSTWSVA